jgi:uncharacterized protein (TIGR02099 family)
LLLAWSLGLLAWLTLHWVILPRLDDWRPRIEAQATRAMGQPVQIGQIAVHSSGWVPAFELRDVVLRDARGREALRLPQVSAALSVSSLLTFKLRFEQLLIDDARLEVRRDVQGRWHVAGLDVDATTSAVDGSAAADWFFEQHEFVIRRGLLRWVDEKRAAPPLQLSDVQLVVRNSTRSHELRLDATPPPEWGQRFALVGQARAPLLARAGDWQRWKGTLYADLPQADVSSLRRHVDLPIELQQGQAALRAWVDWDQGVPMAMTVDAALRQVFVRLAPALEPLAFESLGGHFVAERHADGVKLAVDRLAFVTAEGQQWAASQIGLQWQQVQTLKPGAVAADHPVTGGQFQADRLDLGLLADLAERLPIGSGLRSLLYQLNPEGTVRQLQAHWSGPLDAPTRYSAQASVKGLAIAAAGSPEAGGIGRPGWRGADLELRADQAGGQAELSVKNGAIELPGVFEQAEVPVHQFAAQLQWRIEPAVAAAAPASASAEPGLPRVELKVVNARFDNDDARGALNATWHSGAGTGFGKGGRLPGVLEMSGTLAEGKAARVARYLPLGIGAGVRSWVSQAVQGGQLRNVVFRVKGDLWDFPYVNRRDGEFRIASQVQDLTLAPVPSVPAGGGEPAYESPWPAFSNISAELVFDRNSLQFQQAKGKLWGVDLSDVQGRIRELSEHAVLEIDGTARGPLADLLRYVHDTPLSEWTSGALDHTTATGPAELKLGLNIPLGRSVDTVVKASVQLGGNDVRVRPDLPLLPAARGRVDITHKGVQLAGVRTQVAGGEAQIDGGTQPDGSLRFAVAGTATADGLRRTPELGLVTRWAQRLQGQSPYKLLIGVQNAQVEWQVASNLVGMAIDLPAPLQKAAEVPMALRIGATSQALPRLTQRLSAAEQRSAIPPEWLRLELGPLQASLVIDHSQAEPQVLRSALAFSSPLPEPVAGGRAVLSLPSLDADAWRDLLASGNSGITTPGTSGADGQWLPRSVQLKTPELLTGGRRITGVTLDLQRLSVGGDEGWRAQVAADQAAGSVTYIEPRGANAAGRVRARLQRLSLPPAEADKVVDSVAGLLERATTAVPALDIEIDDFELRGHKLGALSVEAINRVGAEAGEPLRNAWQLTRLQLKNADAHLAATGRWLAQPGQRRRHMALDFTLDVTDGGGLLKRLGFGEVLGGTQGKLHGSLGWDGSPLSLDMPTLSGNVALALQTGRFLKADPGAARLLGVLSLQALPRRLLLDFRDVFEEGFAFDTALGDLRIQQGVASTQNLRFRGVQALIAMEGQADIARESQDLHVVVLPELNTASASLAYVAVNPAVGLGALVGQWLLREPLRQASAREFRITGSFSDPKVDRIERGLLDPLPRAAVAAAEAAAQPASAAAPNRP